MEQANPTGPSGEAPPDAVDIRRSSDDTTVGYVRPDTDDGTLEIVLTVAALASSEPPPA